MTTLPQTLTTLMLGAALTAAVAGPQEDCMDQAAKKLQPGAAYLGHKKIFTGATTAAFSIPATLTLPSAWQGTGLYPIFKKSSSGMMTLSTDMPNIFFYDIPATAITKPGQNLTEKNFDDIGFLISDNHPSDDNIRPDEARNYTITPTMKNFVETVRSCLAQPS